MSRIRSTRLPADRGSTALGRRPRKTHGQASVEYAVICVALALALGVGLADDASALREFVEALRTAYRRFSFALSLPT